MRRALNLAVVLVAWACAGQAAEPAKTSSEKAIIVSDGQGGTTIGKVDGEAVILQKTPDGMIGKMGKDAVVVHQDGQGNSIGKIGGKKVFCHRDPDLGLTLCK